LQILGHFNLLAKKNIRMLEFKPNESFEQLSSNYGVAVAERKGSLEKLRT